MKPEASRSAQRPQLSARCGPTRSTTVGLSPILDFPSHEAKFQYDASGALVAAIRKTDPGAFPGQYDSNVRTDYAYDGAGRLATLAHRQLSAAREHPALLRLRLRRGRSD